MEIRLGKINGVFLKWGYPQLSSILIGFPQLSSILIGFSLIFHDKPESYRGTMGYPHDYGKPQMNIIGALGKRGIKAAPGREWGCFLGWNSNLRGKLVTSLLVLKDWYIYIYIYFCFWGLILFNEVIFFAWLRSWDILRFHLQSGHIH